MLPTSLVKEKDPAVIPNVVLVVDVAAEDCALIIKIAHNITASTDIENFFVVLDVMGRVCIK